MIPFWRKFCTTTTFINSAGCTNRTYINPRRRRRRIIRLHGIGQHHTYISPHRCCRRRHRDRNSSSINIRRICSHRQATASPVVVLPLIVVVMLLAVVLMVKVCYFLIYHAQ